MNLDDLMAGVRIRRCRMDLDEMMTRLQKANPGRMDVLGRVMDHSKPLNPPAVSLTDAEMLSEQRELYAETLLEIAGWAPADEREKLYRTAAKLRKQAEDSDGGVRFASPDWPDKVPPD